MLHAKFQFALCCVLVGTAAAEPTEHWAFQPIRDASPPAVRDTAWPASTIDRFILARLESADLRPAPDADRQTLIRRLHFDIIGLPPTADAVERFDADRSPNAYDRLIDTLLASPHFAARWGRHWLDVARFAESTGGGRSQLFRNAWRYRDYVIDAFDRDKPYDRFLTEQIAGDLLPFEDARQRTEQLIATGFLALGPKNLDNQDKERLRMDVVDEQIDTVGQAVLGLTLGCARCHDHKFDPIPTADYYALAGIFRSTKTLLPGNVSGFVEPPLPIPAEWEQALERHASAVADAKKRLATAKREHKDVQSQIEDLRTAGAAASDSATLASLEASVATAQSKIDAIESALARLNRDAPPPRPLAVGVRDEPEPADAALCIRGNVHTLGDSIPRGFLTALKSISSPPAIDAGASGRLALARWVTHPDNPLARRVIVNRVWHHLFGAGLVPSVDNFGQMGQPPSHPELLDWLAARFAGDEWSIKKTIRRIVRSRVYRLSARTDDRYLPRDPSNRWFGRARRRPLDAEVLRDAILAVSGRLDDARGGPTIRDDAASEFDYAFGDFPRRSVYLPVFRNTPHDWIDVFNGANPNLVTGRRPAGIVPTQALSMLNSPFVLDHSRIAAARLLAVADLDDTERIELAYRRTLGRPPSADERRFAIGYLRESGINADAHPDRRLDVWSRLQQALFACVDFRFLN